MTEKEELNEFWLLELDERNKQDLQTWIDGDQLVGIVDEVAGGVIGYINRAHADNITRLLNNMKKSEE